MTTAGEGRGPGNSGPFLLPGSPPMRETLEGWEQWRRTRYGFVAAPRLDLAAWRALSPRRLMLHDLHRAATHANLPLLQTPMTQAVTRLLHGRIRSNALKHKPTTRAGVMVTGGGYQGKTETTCEIAATFQDAWLDMHRHLNPRRGPRGPRPARARRLRADTGDREAEEHLQGHPGLLRGPAESAHGPARPGPCTTTELRRCCWTTSRDSASTGPMTRTPWTCCGHS